MTAYANAIARPPRTLTDLEQRTLLKITGQRRDGYRDHMIYSLALGTGLREHEIVALDVGDIASADGKPRRRVQLRVYKRSNDDAASQQIILPETVRAKLTKFLRWKQQEGQSVAPEAPLFMSRKHRRLSTRRVREAFRQWQERAGFDRPFSFHSLRHSACSNLYRRTRDIRLTQRFARHSSIISTSIYTHPSDEELVRSVQDLVC